MGKLRVFEIWLGVLVAWSLLPPDQLWEGRTFALLGCALLIEVGTTSAALCLDDVTGLRDGIDAVNYSDAPRSRVSKPLVAGALTERQALAFASGAISVVVLAIAIGWLIAAPVPWWLFALTLTIVAVALNYSYGLRLSYRTGGAELIIFVCVGATLLLPFALVTETVTGLVVVESVLMGLFMLQVATFSNSQDASGDRAFDRRTIAASSSRSFNHIFIVGVFSLSWSIVVIGVSTGFLAPLYLLLFLVTPLQIRQLRAGRNDEWLLGRRIGFLALRVAVCILVAVNLYVGS